MYYIQSISSISPASTFRTEEFLSSPLEEKEGYHLSAIEPDYKEFIADANLRRRMSRIVKMGVCAALDCLSRAENNNPDAIITGTGLGCLADTEKFLKSIIDNEEQLLNPTAFIQSTFNTIGAQIALILKSNNYNFTYVHRGFSFESALLDAMMLLKENKAENVLVGAMDEITLTSADIMRRMGFWRKGVKMGEGAQFFVLSNKKSHTDYAVIKYIDTFLLSNNISPEKRINQFLERNGLSTENIDLILTGYETDLLTLDSLQNIPNASFKPVCGEYQTAASFGVWCAANILKRQAIPSSLKASESLNLFNRILVYNPYRNTNHSLILLEKA